METVVYPLATGVAAFAFTFAMLISLFVVTALAMDEPLAMGAHPFGMTLESHYSRGTTAETGLFFRATKSPIRKYPSEIK